MNGDVIDGQGGAVIINGDGTITIRPLTPDEIAQQAIDAQEAADRQAARNAIETRATSFIQDTNRATWMDKLQNASLADLEAYVRNQINADGVSNLATAQTCLKRIETALVIIIKLIALDARR